MRKRFTTTFMEIIIPMFMNVNYINRGTNMQWGEMFNKMMP